MECDVIPVMSWNEPVEIFRAHIKLKDMNAEPENLEKCFCNFLLEFLNLNG